MAENSEQGLSYKTNALQFSGRESDSSLDKRINCKPNAEIGLQIPFHSFGNTKIVVSFRAKVRLNPFAGSDQKMSSAESQTQYCEAIVMPIDY